jgi:hypothetical protein
MLMFNRKLVRVIPLLLSINRRRENQWRCKKQDFEDFRYFSAKMTENAIVIRPIKVRGLLESSCHTVFIDLDGL